MKPSLVVTRKDRGAGKYPEYHIVSEGLLDAAAKSIQKKISAGLARIFPRNVKDENGNCMGMDAGDKFEIYHHLTEVERTQLHQLAEELGLGLELPME